MLSYLSSELHIAFKPFWHASNEAETARAGEAVARASPISRTDGRTLPVRRRIHRGGRLPVRDAALGQGVRACRCRRACSNTSTRLRSVAPVKQALAEEGLA
jgi:hypothetical protein